VPKMVVMLMSVGSGEFEL